MPSYILQSCACTKYLWITKNATNGKYIGKIDLDFARLKYGIEDTSNYKYCLSFHRNGNSLAICVKEPSDKDAWMGALSKYCILGEFEHRYNIIEKLGNGSMGEVKYIHIGL